MVEPISVGRFDLGFEHVDDPRQRLVLGVAALARIGARGVARDIDQQHAPHVRLLERALERDRKPAIDDEGAQHLDGVLAADDVGRQWLFAGTGHGSWAYR